MDDSLILSPLCQNKQTKPIQSKPNHLDPPPPHPSVRPSVCPSVHACRMLGVAPRDIDAVWALVAAATARGELGFSAKVAPGLGAEAAPNLLICVYLRDFNRRGEVRRVLLRLDALLPPPPANSKSNNSRAPRYLACSNWGFKPDVHTSLGINGGNKWKLKATIYSRKAVLGWGESP